MDYAWTFWGFLWIPLIILLIWAAFAWGTSGTGYRGDLRRYGYGSRFPHLATAWPYVNSPPSSLGVHRGRGPRGYRRSDGRILEEINDQLMINGEVDAEDVSVRVDDGVVQLTGSVGSRHEKRIVEAIADSVAGVNDVRNELAIRRPAREQRPRAA